MEPWMFEALRQAQEELGQTIDGLQRTAVIAQTDGDLRTAVVRLQAAVLELVDEVRALRAELPERN